MLSLELSVGACVGLCVCMRVPWLVGVHWTQLWTGRCSTCPDLLFMRARAMRFSSPLGMLATIVGFLKCLSEINSHFPATGRNWLESAPILYLISGSVSIHCIKGRTKPYRSWPDSAVMGLQPARQLPPHHAAGTGSHTPMYCIMHVWRSYNDLFLWSFLFPLAQVSWLVPPKFWGDLFSPATGW